MEKTYINGCEPSKVDVRDYRIACSVNEIYPETFELEMCKVKNQGGTCSCVAHSAAETMEYFHKTETGNYDELSTQFIYGYRPATYYQGKGMSIRDALNTMLKVGNLKESDMPGNDEMPEAKSHVMDKFDANLKNKAYYYHITSYFQLKTIQEIMHSIMTYGPVIVNMKWYNGAKINSKGVYTYEKTKNYGNHAVVIYGWGANGWIVRNSWGSAWGQDGNFFIPFDFDFDEVWGVSDDYLGVSEDITSPFSSKLGDLFAKLINSIIWFVKALRRS